MCLRSRPRPGVSTPLRGSIDTAQQRFVVPGGTLFGYHEVTSLSMKRLGKQRPIFGAPRASFAPWLARRTDLSRQARSAEQKTGVRALETEAQWRARVRYGAPSSIPRKQLMTDRDAQRRDVPGRFLREPLVHFFALGALLFGISALCLADERRVVEPPGLVSSLERRFRDLHGREPSATERAEALATWRRDEALFREALQKNLHYDDATIRGILIDKMRAEAALELPPLRPTEAELDAWLRAHEDRYALPLRYDFQSLTFEQAAGDIAPALTQLAAGTEPEKLGRTVTGGKLTAPDLARRLPAPVAERIPALPQGSWERIDGETQVWLVRVRDVIGGLPTLAEVRARVEADFIAAAREKDIAERLQRTVDLYTFEAAP